MDRFAGAHPDKQVYSGLFLAVGQLMDETVENHRLCLKNVVFLFYAILLGGARRNFKFALEVAGLTWLASRPRAVTLLRCKNNSTPS